MREENLEDGPNEVELNDSLPCGALLVKMGRREGELEVYDGGFAWVSERREKGKEGDGLFKVVLLPDSAWPVCGREK